MNLTLRIRLLPTEDQKTQLLSVMERFNEAANFAAQVGFEAKVYSQPSIHKLVYKEIRERFGLSAQLAVRAIGKAVEVFKRDKTVCPVFRTRGTITYDERILSFKGLDRVSLTTLEGRQLIPIVFGEYQGERFDRIKGQVDLVYSAGQFHLYASIKVPQDPQIEVKDFLGVDLGIVNIATDSDGTTHSGATVETVRKRLLEHRKALQRCGSKSAKRRLKTIRTREANFRRNENHRISNAIVAKAKTDGVGVALEELAGITSDMTRFRREQRSRMRGWRFAQLRGFITYKAVRVGVPVVLVEPASTSRTCSGCGHCQKQNRKNRNDFVCVHCGFSLAADHNAAINIKTRASLRMPIVGVGFEYPPMKS